MTTEKSDPATTTPGASAAAAPGPDPSDPVADPAGAAASVEDIRAALKTVYDPEIGINVVDLGLVYDIVNNDGDVRVDFTLTSPACPLAPVLLEQITYAASRVPGVQNVTPQLVWAPPWDPRTMCSEEAKAELGIW